MQEDDAPARDLRLVEGVGRSARRCVLVALGILGLAPGCDRDPGEARGGAPAQARSAGSAAPSPAPDDARAQGDAARGKDLVRRFECSRCHFLPEDVGIAERDRSCVGCHRWILDGAPSERGVLDPEAVAGWQQRFRFMRHLPSLARGYYRRAWLERFLVEPTDLRPNLPATMPRLAVTKEQARDIAAYLGQEAPAPDGGVAGGGGESALAGANLERGLALLKEKGCSTCHVMTGVSAPELGSAARSVRALKDAAPLVNLWSGSDLAAVIALAPDLRHARERFDVPTLLTWITDPDAIKRVRPQMPKTPVSAEEARDIAAYLVKAELSPPEARAIPARLPPVNRDVRYDEVAEKVLQRTCRHCHAEPDDALGEGGPGNTGGFGFAPRGLHLAEFEGIAAGSLDDHGERRSVFSKAADGTPLLVRVLLARQAEEAGRPDPEVRGMPLGMPSLTPEEISLVEAWVAQGHPR